MRSSKLPLAITLLLIMLLLPMLASGEGSLVGKAAPDFKMQDQNGDWHTLENYKGKWLVLYFYPKNDTPGCTTEACNFRNNIYAYKAIDAAVVGVSLDDVASHAKFASKYKLPFTLLSDADGSLSKSYGVLRDYKLIKIAARQSFLINPQGVIVKHYEKVDSETHSEEVIEALKELIAEAG